MTRARIDLKVTDLPSRGILYEPNSELAYHPYTFGDISYISDSKLSQESLVKFLSDGIVFSEGVENLTVEDFWYICLLRKLSSMNSSEYKVQYKCKNCGSLSSDVFTQVSFDDIKAEDLPIETDIDGKELVFSPLTVKDYMKVIDKPDLDSTTLLALNVTNMKLDEALDIIKNAVGEDAQVLSEIDEYLYHGISKHEAKCTECGHVNYVDLTDHKESIIRPFRSEERSVKSRIRFGKNRNGESTSDK